MVHLPFSDKIYCNGNLPETKRKKNVKYFINSYEIIGVLLIRTNNIES